MNHLHNLLSRLFWCLVMWTGKLLLKNKIPLLSHERPLHEPLVSEEWFIQPKSDRLIQHCFYCLV